MSLIKKMRKQRAIYWALLTTGTTGYGQATWAAPVEIPVRWEDGFSEVIGGSGNVPGAERVVPTVKVFVDRDIIVGSMLMLGSLSSGTPTDPREAPLALDVKKFEKIPNLKATEFLRIAYA